MEKRSRDRGQRAPSSSLSLAGEMSCPRAGTKPHPRVVTRQSRATTPCLSPPALLKQLLGGQDVCQSLEWKEQPSTGTWGKLGAHKTREGTLLKITFFSLKVGWQKDESLCLEFQRKGSPAMAELLCSDFLCSDFLYSDFLCSALISSVLF